MAEYVYKVGVASRTVPDDSLSGRDPVAEGFELTVTTADRAVDVLRAGGQDIVVESLVGWVDWPWFSVADTREITYRNEYAE